MAEPRKETEIAERAYYIWETQGRPHGRDQEHWHQAAAEVTPAAPKRKAKAAPAAKAPRKGPAAKAKKTS